VLIYIFIENWYWFSTSRFLAQLSKPDTEYKKIGSLLDVIYAISLELPESETMTHELYYKLI
jgi:hypothetical protein